MVHPASLKFFIVDDDPFYRMLYNQHLKNLGFKDNILMDNGDDCLKKLDMQPDVILLDYNMPPSNGLDILKKIKTTNPNIYILLISGQTDIQVALNALKFGATDYIVKGEEDLDMINEVLSKILTTRVPISKLYEMN